MFCTIKIQGEKYVNEYITDALFYLMKRKNFDSISITEIVNKAGVSRNSFYRNFSSKEDIIKKWIQRVTDKFIQLSNINYKNDSTKEYFLKLFTHLEKYKEISILLCKANMLHYLKDEFDRIFLLKANNANEEYNYAFLAGGLYNIYYHWIKNGFKETPQELANMFNNFYILKGDRK